MQLVIECRIRNADMYKSAPVILAPAATGPGISVSNRRAIPV